MLAAAAGLCLAVDPSTDLEGFRKSVRPLVRGYIFGHYQQFASSELTFRDLKTHIAESLSLTYEDLQPDEVSSVIEDESDKIANRCDGGKVSVQSCMARFNYKPKDEV